jgi:hypothetical protein
VLPAKAGQAVTTLNCIFGKTCLFHTLYKLNLKKVAVQRMPVNNDFSNQFFD